MHRSFPAAALAVSIACAVPSASLAGNAEALGRARALIERNEPKPAAELLEATLPAVPAADRAALLALLRQAYESAARQAEAAGKTDEADEFRENLAILDRKPRSTAAPASTPLSALPKAAAPTAPPADTALPRARLNPDAEERPVAVEAPAAKAASRDADVVRAEATTPLAPATSPRAQPADFKQQIALANKAFRAQAYDEAGRLYGALVQQNQLPKELYNHLAYCRYVAVAKRINAKPATAQEWAEIDAEITRIQEISPKLWFGDYLRNKAAELSKAQNRTQSNKVVVRGAAPEEPELPQPAPNGPARERRPAAEPDGATGSLAPRRAGNDGSSARGTPESGRWQVHETDNFRVFHADPELAQRVAAVAERTREEQTKRWAGAGPREPWTPKCDVYLYPTAKIFSAMTGQPEDSPGFSTMGMDAGRINCRRVNLRADHPKITAAILPHEVTHVVLADFFPQKQIPRWADEGMAVLAEPHTEQRLRAADLDAPLASGRLFHMGDLMVMDYPNAEHWALYYAQSVSLTRFLVELGTPGQFMDFVHGCQQRSHEDELRRVYKIDGFVELERRWVEFAKNQAASASATADNAKRDADTASR